MTYKGKTFVTADCESKDAKRLFINDLGHLCFGKKCLMRKVNKQGKVKLQMGKREGNNGSFVGFAYKDGKLGLKLKVFKPNWILS